MAVFAPRPRYQQFNVGEQIALGLDRPFSVTRTLSENFQQGILDSFGLGTAIQELTTPPLQDPNPIPFRGETPENYAARKARNEAAALSEEEYKASPYFRDELKWEPGMTEDRAAAISKRIDTRNVRAYFSQKQPIAAFLGGFAGQAFDPVNYVPVFGPLARTAAIARFGSIGGRALLSASEAAINTAAFGMLTADVRQSLGNDASFATIVSEIAMSALIGGAFGTAGGIISRGRDVKLRIAEAKARDAIKTVEMQQKAAVAANSAIDSFLNTGDVKLDPTAVAARREVETLVNERTAAPRKLAQETSAVTGNKVGQVVVTPTGRRVAVQPEVVELSSLTHAEGALQVRNRRNAASATQVEEMATTLDPARLMPSIDAGAGAPLVGDDNIIDSGNGRTMAIRRAYENYPEKAAEYRQALIDAGFPEAAEMAQPVLVQRRLTKLSADARAQFNADANTSSTARMSPVELAQMDRAALTDDVMGLLDVGPVTSKANRAFVQRFLAELPTNERTALVDPAGNLSAEGVRRIENALVAQAYGDVDAGIVRRFAEAVDDNTRSIVGALSDVAGRWAKFRADTKAGVVAPHLDVTPELAEALRRISDWREQAAREKRPVSKVIQEGMAQLDLLSGEISPVAQTFIRMFYQSDAFTQATGRDSLAAMLSDMIESGYELGRPSLFGDALPDVPAVKVLENAIRRNVSADLLTAGDALSRAEEISAAAEADSAGTAGIGDRQGFGEEEQALLVEESAEFVGLTKHQQPGTARAERFVDVTAAPEGQELFDALGPAQTHGEAYLAADGWVLNKGGTELEYLAAFDLDGNLIAAGRGTRGNVDFPKHLLDEVLAGRASYLTHNHPSNRAFSTADINIAMHSKGGTITAMGSRGSILTARPAVQMGDPREFGRWMAQYERKVYDFLHAKIVAKTMSFDEANLLHSYVQSIGLHRLGVLDMSVRSTDVPIEKIEEVLDDFLRWHGRELGDAARRAGLDVGDVRAFDRARALGGAAEPDAARAFANRVPRASVERPLFWDRPVKIRGKRVVVDPNQLRLLEAERLVAETDVLAPSLGFQQPAWHGTPHVFEQFSLTKVGTGEGHQAYGYGLYFAGDRKTAEYYRNVLSNPSIMVKDDTGAAFDVLTHPTQLVREAGRFLHDFGGDVNKALEALDADMARGMYARNGEGETMRGYLTAWAERGIEMEDAGRLYRVTLPDDVELMNWDAPLSEQPDGVKRVMEELGRKYLLPEVMVDGKTLAAWELDNNLVRAPDIASEKLRSLLIETRGDVAATKRRFKEELPLWVETEARRAGMFDALDNLGEVKLEEFNLKPGSLYGEMTGQQFYDRLIEELPPGGLRGRDVQASQLMAAAGVPGHRYLDQGSRGNAAVAEARGSLSVWEKALEKTPDDPYIKGEVEARRQELAELEARLSYNYVIYDDARVQTDEVYDHQGNPVMVLREDGEPFDPRGFSEEERQLAFDLSVEVPKAEVDGAQTPETQGSPPVRILSIADTKKLRELRAFRELQVRNGVRSRLPEGPPPPPVTPIDNPTERSTVRDVDGMQVKFEDEYQAELFDLGDYLLALNDVSPEQAATGDFPRSLRIGPAQSEVQRLWNVMAGHLVRDEAAPMRNLGDFIRAAMTFAGQGRDELTAKLNAGRTEMELGNIIEPEYRAQWDAFTRQELRDKVDLLSRSVDRTIDTPPAPDRLPDGITEAAGRVGTPVDPMKFGEQYGLEQDGTFAEEADLEALIAEGRLLPAEQEALDAADQLYADAEAYGKTLEVAAWCVR